MFGLLPMSKPPTYTGVRHHALVSAENLQDQSIEDPTESIAARLFHFMRAGKKGPAMDFLDVASECSDHLLAGIDTTSVTLMFAIFALSQQENREFQDKLRQEIKSISNEFVVDDVVNALAADKLPYLDAVIKETLRLYAPLPGSEPRWSANAEIIDGYHIPAHTVVSMSPYCLHRNEQVFEDPLNFNPNRWLGQSEQVTEMKRWFWAFSSGSRMCIGMHLAMAEMTTLLASVYRKYKTEIVPQFTGVSPGVTARYEVFYDEKFEKIEEHECWVMFKT
ncbi:cytochrome P450 [Aspergillus ambiguus]|uniref:cytochrome P450 n=1 Tax=Aspergillus ambiguus TaxID=176160 RepID=UPI003CCC9C1C